MSKRFTIVTLALTAIVSFLVGAIVAGGTNKSTVTAGTASRTPSMRPVVHTGAASPASALVNFADVVELINPAVVNIDATARGRETRRRGRIRNAPHGRVGVRDRQPARIRALGDRGRDQLPRTQVVRRKPRQLHSDRRRDQLRQQRRAAD